MRFSCNHCGKQFATQDELAMGRVYRIACRCGNSIVLRVEASLCDRGTPPPFKPLRAVPPPLPEPRARGVAAIHRRSFASPARAGAQGSGPSARVADGMERAPSRPIAHAPPPPRSVALPACEPRRDSRPASPHEDPFAPREASEPELVSSREFSLVTAAHPATRRGLPRLDPDASGEDGDERSGLHWVPLEWANRTLRTRAFVAGVAAGAGVALFVLATLLVAEGSASVVAVALPSGVDTAAAAAPTPAPQKAPRAARTSRTAMASAAGPRTRSPEASPASSTTKAAEPEIAAAPSSRRGAVETDDSTPVPTSVDAGEPAAEDAEAVAEASPSAPESEDAEHQEDGARGEDAARPESAARQADGDGPGGAEPAADDRNGAETQVDAPTSRPVPATDTIATAKPVSD